MSPETVQRKNPRQHFNKDKPFQEQQFNLKTTSTGSTRHLIQKETADGEQESLCGTTIHLGTPQTLNQLAEKGSVDREPSYYTGKICRSCIKIFEKRTDRKYTEDLQEVAEE